LRIVLPIVMLALGLAAWELVVRIGGIPPYVLPAPDLVVRTLFVDRVLLSQSLLVTLVTTFEGFLLAAGGGVGLAVLFNQSRLVEYSLYPYAVILQVTPIVAVAPLLSSTCRSRRRCLPCAWIVAFFPGAGEHHARPQFGRPQSRRPVFALRRLARPSAVGVSSCRRRCPICWAACASPAGCH